METKSERPQNKHLKPCKPGETHNPNGRPRKLTRHIIEEWKSQGIEPITAAQVKDAYEQLMNLKESELQTIINNKDLPMFIRITAKEMLKQKGFEIIERMVDRAQGKAKQSTDVTSGGQPIQAITGYIIKE